MSTISSALVDQEWFAVAWYGQTLTRLCAEYGLQHLRPPVGGPLALVPGLAGGHFVAASSDVNGADTTLSEAVVIGGPCMGDCLRLATLEALYDVVQPLVVGRALGLRVVLYLGDREEILGGGKESRWTQLAQRFEQWIAAVAEAVGVDRVTVVRTSSARHEAALAGAGLPSDAVDPVELDRAFHLGSVPVRPQDEGGREVTRRVIGAHLPGVVVQHLNGFEESAPPRVLMVENLQQAGVFRVASRRAAALGQQLGFIAYLPAPSPSGRSRMYRAEPWDKIPAMGLRSLLVEDPVALHPYTKQFFRSWLDAPLRAAVADAASGWSP